jgi:hypothetical protein
MTNTQSITETSAQRAVHRRRWQWFGLLAAPIAYLLVAVFTYGVVPAACQFGLLQMSLFGVSALAILAFAVTLGGLLLALWGGYVAYHNRETAGKAGAPPDDTARFISVGGIMLSVLFILLTVIAGLSTLAFQPCHPL